MDGKNTCKAFIRAFKRKKQEDPDYQITMKVFEKARVKYSALAQVNMLECLDEDQLNNMMYLQLINK